MQATLFVSVSQAFLLNLAIFWCTTANSPVATTVTGKAFHLDSFDCGWMFPSRLHSLPSPLKKERWLVSRSKTALRKKVENDQQ